MRYVCLFFMLVFSLSGCSDKEPVVVVDMGKVESVSPPGQEAAVTYAYLPQYSHSVSFERHRRLLTYLRAKTGLNIRQVFSDSFAEHIQMVDRGEIDISFSNPLVYIRIAGNGATAFARAVEPGTGANFQGQIIVRSDNPAIRRLEDCRGKRLIAVDPDSAGGYLYPLGLLLDHGITRSDFREIAFASGSGGKQETVVLAVHAGVYDVGSIRKGALDVVRDKIDLSQIRVLAETEAYPGWVYACRAGFDTTLRDRIARAMFALDIQRAVDRAVLSDAGMVGIIAARDSDYDSIRRLSRRLNLNGTTP